MLTSIKTNELKFESQKIAMMYFRVAIILFGAQLLMGLIAAAQFMYPNFLFELFDFSVARMVHLNALIVWMLYAMIGATYYMIPFETEREVIGAPIAKLAFWGTNRSSYDCCTCLYLRSSWTGYRS